MKKGYEAAILLKSALWMTIPAVLVMLVLNIVFSLVLSAGVGVGLVDVFAWASLVLTCLIVGVLIHKRHGDRAPAVSVATGLMIFLLLVVAGLFFDGGASVIEIPIKLVVCGLGTIGGAYLMSIRKRKFKSRYRR